MILVQYLSNCYRYVSFVCRGAALAESVTRAKRYGSWSNSPLMRGGKEHGIRQNRAEFPHFSTPQPIVFES